LMQESLTTEAIFISLRLNFYNKHILSIFVFKIKKKFYNHIAIWENSPHINRRFDFLGVIKWRKK